MAESPSFRRQVNGSLSEAELRALEECVDTVIEARGTFCPEPVIRTQNAVRDLEPGATALLLADDAGVVLDIPAWCMSTRNEFLGIVRRTRHLRVFVRKS